MINFKKVFKLIKTNQLPEDFNQWDLVVDNGWTVAHEVARYGNLPEGFNQWSLADDEGWTVAHEAARCGKLPEDFNQWHLAKKDGWSVAHVAARCGSLPEGFNQWDLANKDGWTVAYVALKYETITQGKYDEIQQGKGAKKMLNFKEVLKRIETIQLPEDFNQWDLADENGITITHMAARHGSLPEGFDKRERSKKNVKL